MFIDSRALPADAAPQADVCIIGSGAAGITLAREFIGRSLRVILLESGGLTADSQTQKLYEGRNTGLPYPPLTVARLRYFGGTTNHWVGECRPFDEVDFEARDGVPFSGWPFPKSHLEPFYRRAEPVCQLQPVPYDARAWATEDAPPIALGGSRLATHILQFSPPTRFGEVYRNDLERAENVSVYLHANALEIKTDTNARTVTQVAATTLEGKVFSVSAKWFVLAAGGVENPRLLLLSNRTQPAGLGNGQDLVGRFFMEHVEMRVGLWLRSNPELPLDLYKPHDVHTAAAQGRIAASLTLAPEVIRQERLLNFRYEIRPLQPHDAPQSKGERSLRHIARSARQRRVPDQFMSHLWTVLTDLGGTAGAVRRRIAGKPPALTLLQVSEQAPNPESRVKLSDQQDRFGQRRVELAWRLSETDRRSAVRTQELIARQLGQLGLGRVKSLLGADANAWQLTGQYHHMGTTRMHEDPTQGVVDANGLVHGLSNLFIGGSSVFPTSGSGTPTLTIVALALRLADRIKELLA